MERGQTNPVRYMQIENSHLISTMPIWAATGRGYTLQKRAHIPIIIAIILGEGNKCSTVWF